MSAQTEIKVERRPGEARIKAEFLRQVPKRDCSNHGATTDVTEDTSGANHHTNEPACISSAPASAQSSENGHGPAKTGSGEGIVDECNQGKADSGRQNDEKCQKRPPSPSAPTAAPKRAKGQNKHRKPTVAHAPAAERLCGSVARNEPCPYEGKCRFSHDTTAFLSAKLPDIGNRCVIFEERGCCPFGLMCRFGGQHLTSDGKNVIDSEKMKSATTDTRNLLSKELQTTLRKKKYDFSLADKIVAILPKPKPPTGDASAGSDNAASRSEVPPVKTVGALTDEDIIRFRPCEKKTVDFSDKLYLAPLTTVGNLPFRRICKRLGADITCGEMAMSTNLLQGQTSEWALLKRHSSEDLFGVQVCGSFPDSMTRCAQLLRESVDVDFVDINVGCPIDLVFQKGGGCALMGRQTRFESIVRGMAAVLDVPLTVKMRTGIHDKTFTAHKLIPKVREWGASLVTVHGRSREQRYTRAANWDYLNECSQAAAPMPLFGNGDILSYEDVLEHRQATGVSGVMIARGALIKPWIFTEIKEQRHWDISSSERFDMLQDFTRFGLCHWGSDKQGVETVRRFLLEWLSFLYRYVPVGLLEVLPQRINERPPPYYGRDDLETLMASGNCQDWISLSERLLGPVSPDFHFLPKHKANSYATPVMSTLTL